MQISSVVRQAGACALIAGVSLPGYGQTCPFWSPEFSVNPAPFVVKSLELYDDGTGAALYAGGAGLGPFDPDRIGSWDGTSWSQVGGGIPAFSPGFCGCGAQVLALKRFDDGSGDSLFVGGSFIQAGGTNTGAMARYDGTSFFAMGDPFELPGCADCPPTINALTVFDDGGGDKLYAGGWFLVAGKTTINHVAQWDGSAWNPLGSGLSAQRLAVNAQVYALATWDNGGSNDLYVGGSFDDAGGVGAEGIARWDGTQFSALGSGVDGQVRAITNFDDGTGDKLYVAGDFETVGGVVFRNIACWDGTSWTDLAGGLNGRANALTVFDDGSGPALYAGGDFTFAGGVFVGNVARWNGTGWEDISLGVDGEVFALAPLNVRGPGVYVGGDFLNAGGRSSERIARWTGCELCYADCDQSTGAGVLDIFDFLCFQDAFVNGDPYACECDTTTGPGVCDIFDFLCFQDAFVGGCP